MGEPFFFYAVSFPRPETIFLENALPLVPASRAGASSTPVPPPTRPLVPRRGNGRLKTAFRESILNKALNRLLVFDDEDDRHVFVQIPTPRRAVSPKTLSYKVDISSPLSPAFGPRSSAGIGSSTWRFGHRIWAADRYLSAFAQWRQYLPTPH